MRRRFAATGASGRDGRLSFRSGPAVAGQRCAEANRSSHCALAHCPHDERLLAMKWHCLRKLPSLVGCSEVGSRLVQHLAPRVKRTVAWIYPLVHVGLVSRWISAREPSKCWETGLKMSYAKLLAARLNAAARRTRIRGAQKACPETKRAATDPWNAAATACRGAVSTEIPCFLWRGVPIRAASTRRGWLGIQRETG